MQYICKLTWGVGSEQKQISALMTSLFYLKKYKGMRGQIIVLFERLYLMDGLSLKVKIILKEQT